MNDKQKVIGDFIIKNLDVIGEVENLKELADRIGVSQVMIPTVLTKLNLGTFTVLKKKIKSILKVK